MAHLAFLGLGQMGSPMAARLLEAGHSLTVWNRTPGKDPATGEARGDSGGLTRRRGGES